MIKIEKTTDGNMALFAPYDAAAIPEFRNAGGKWNPALKAWVFPAEAKEALTKVIEKRYGVSPFSNGVPARITALKYVSASKDSVRFGGIVLAKASGRDSGARTGAGVILEDGKIGSCGSVKNWGTDVEAGAKFLVKSFPEGVASDTEFSVEYLTTVSKPTRNPALASFSDDDLRAELKARTNKVVEIKRGECPLCMGIFNRTDIDEIIVKFSERDFSGDVCQDDCGHSFRVREGVISLI